MTKKTLIGINGKIGVGKDTVGKIIQHLTSEWADEEFQDTDMLDVRSNWKIKKFAGKLKQIVSILTGIPVEDLELQEVKDRVLVEEWDRYLLKEHWINDEYAEYEQFTYFATNEDMQKYVNNMGHTDSTCSQVGKRSITVRQLLQEVGTEAMRNVIHPNIWVNALFADYTHTETGIYNSQNGKILELPNWIITDMRFPNELEAIKQRGGITIRVNRYCYDSAEDFLVCHPDKDVHKIGININMNESSSVIDFEEPARIHGYIPLKKQHYSETALDNADFDYVIENKGSLIELIDKVKDILVTENIIQ